jgi:hypothetical protein
MMFGPGSLAWGAMGRVREGIPGQSLNDGTSVMAGLDRPSLARKGCREGWQGMTVVVGVENAFGGSYVGVSVVVQEQDHY